MLGLGTQVKGHNERRFSVPWSAPAPRLREYVESLRAIWRTWQTGAPLAYEGKHYRFTLMTPEFSPPKNALPPIPVTIAAVGPAMLKLAGRVCDGVRLHGFATRKYLEEVAIPQVTEGLELSGATARELRVLGRRLHRHRRRRGRRAARRSTRCATASPSTARRAATTACSRCTAGTTSALKLHQLSKQGRWSEMAKEVPDEVVRTFAAIGTYARDRARRSRRASAASPTAWPSASRARPPPAWCASSCRTCAASPAASRASRRAGASRGRAGSSARGRGARRRSRPTSRPAARPRSTGRKPLRSKKAPTRSCVVHAKT